MTKLSVVVPCYNESKSIDAIVSRFAKAKPGGRGFELVLVDNGSTDGSAGIMRSAADRNKFVRIATVKRNVGYGFGVLRGLKAGKGEFLCWTHADLQTDPLDAVRAYGIALSQEIPRQCFVKGARKNRPLLDSFFTFGMSVFAALALWKWMPDANAQPNLFHRSFLGSLKNAPHDFSFDLFSFYCAKSHGMRIVRFPVDFSRRLHGQSHWNTSLAGKWKFIKRTAVFILELRRRLSGSGKPG